MAQDKQILENYEPQGKYLRGMYGAMGGNIQGGSNLVPQQGALVPTSSDMEKAIGPKHNQGGMTVAKDGQMVAEIEGEEMVKDGQKVYSDELSPDGKNSFAKLAEVISKKKGKLEAQLADSNVSKIEKSTLERQISNLDKDEEKLFQMQEQMKQEQGIETPMVDAQGMRNGGKIMNYLLGGGYTDIDPDPDYPTPDYYKTNPPNSLDFLRNFKANPSSKVNTPSGGSTDTDSNPDYLTPDYYKTTSPDDILNEEFLRNLGANPLSKINTDKKEKTIIDSREELDEKGKTYATKEGNRNFKYAKDGPEGTGTKGKPLFENAADFVPYVDNFVNLATTLLKPKVPKPAFVPQTTMNTKVNVNDQLSTVDNQIAQASKYIDGNTSNSRTARALNIRTRLGGASQKNQILATKENAENQLENQAIGVGLQTSAQNTAISNQFADKKLQRALSIPAEINQNVVNATEDFQKKQDYVSKERLADRQIDLYKQIYTGGNPDLSARTDMKTNEVLAKWDKNPEAFKVFYDDIMNASDNVYSATTKALLEQLKPRYIK